MMNGLPNIQPLISENRLGEALELLNVYISGHPEDDEAYFERGKINWRLQNYPAAVTDYEKAVSLNPQSGAVFALQLARDVYDFYNPDLLNP